MAYHNFTPSLTFVIQECIFVKFWLSYGCRDTLFQGNFNFDFNITVDLAHTINQPVRYAHRKRQCKPQ